MSAGDDILQTICLDFDGVVNNYKGWRDEGFDTVLDKPYPKAQECIAQLRAMGYRVVINSARCAFNGGVQAIRDWCGWYDIEVDDVTYHKPPAWLYVDDRGYRFYSWDHFMVDLPSLEKTKEKQ